MISSLLPVSHDSTLESEIRGILPQACARLLNSHHLEIATKSVVQPVLRQHLYGFAADPAYRHLFGSFKFPDESWPLSRPPSAVARGSDRDRDRDRDTNDNDNDDNDNDNDNEDDEDLEENWTLSGAQSKADSSGLSSEYLPSRKGKPCGHVFKKGESVYRCKECGLDDSCVLCSKCFKSSDHEGHEVSFSMHSGGCGCCDCGDHEAWRRDVRCAIHHPDVLYPEHLAKGPPSNLSTSSNAQEPAAMLQPIPTELQDLIRQRIREVTDYIVYALVNFPRDTTAPTDARAILRTRPRCSRQDGNFDKNEGYAGPWSIILWNDEKHTYQDVIEVLMIAVRCSRERALASAVNVDNHGSEVIASSTDASRLWDIARKIGSRTLGVTVCAVEDAVVLECIDTLLQWLQDIARVRIGGDETYLGRLVAEVLLQDDRLQNILKNEDKLWKSGRTTLRGVLMSLLVVGQDVKLELSRAYASVYPNMASSFLLTDREPDNSITQFSVQLFSAPSVAAYLVKELDFLSTITMLLYAFFTQQESVVDGVKVLTMPPLSHTGGPVDLESAYFKHKKYFFMFQDLHHLLFHPEVQRHLRKADVPSFTNLLNFLELFNGLNPQIRASTTHVEYETDSWVAAFNLMIHLSKLAKVMGRSFHSKDNEPVDQHDYLSAILKIAMHLQARVREGLAPVNEHSVRFNDKTWYTIAFQISQSHVSFHHPVHLLLAEILKHVDGWADDECSSITQGAYANLSSLIANQAGCSEESTIYMVDEVVRVLALLAQVRAGFWVRNGFGVRAQHLHYREYSLRETTFDQDVFFLQAAFLLVDPSLLIVTLLDRYDLLTVIANSANAGGYFDNAVYDKAQATTMLEELLFLLVTVFSEPCDIEAWHGNDVVRRELIHVLALGPYSYSEIIKNITDRASEDTSFDKVLSQVATFRAPDPSVVSSDVGGTYVLKDELHAQLDPYYYRLTRNQREQVTKILKEKIQADGNFEVRRMQPKGAFRNPRFLGTLASEEFVELVRCSLVWATKDPNAYADTVVDLIYQLLKIALVEVPEGFAPMFAASPALQHLCSIEHLEHFKEQAPKVAYILDTIGRYAPQAVSQHRKPATETRDEAGERQAELLEQKRQAARARQAAIMQQFAAAQKTFLDSVSDDENDEAETVEESLQSPVSVATGNPEETMQTDDVPIKRKKMSNMGSCIVCQEVLDGHAPFGSLALVQTSSFVRLAQEGRIFQEEIFEMPRDWDRDAEHLRPFGLAGRETSDVEGRGGTALGFPRSHKRGLYASACGHMMHISCFNTYCQSIASRHAQQFTRLHPENPERNEFICPLCKSLGNILLPISEDELDDQTPPPSANDGLDFHWLRDAFETARPSNPDLPVSLSLLSDDGRGRIKIWRVAASLPHSSTAMNFSAVSQTDRKLLERLLSVIGPLEAENRMVAGAQGNRPATIPHQLIAYTLAVTEIGLRGKETGTVSGESIPTATAKLLRSLLASLSKLAQIGARTLMGPEVARTALLWLMFGARNGESAVHRAFLTHDPLTFLVQTAAVAPEDFYQFTNLCFYAHLLRISYQLCGPGSQAHLKPTTSLPEEAMRIAECCLALQDARWNRYGGHISQEQRDQANAGAQHAFYHVMPFLRRVAILHGVLFPSVKVQSETPEASEFDRLLSLLRISHISELSGRRHGKSPAPFVSISTILESWDTAWLSGFHVSAGVEGMDAVELEHPVIYELLGLPKSIDSLIESTVTRKCRRCKTVPSDPAICLICGDLVCQQSYCCMEQDPGSEPTHGECNTHMWRCGTSSGIYFLIKRCGLIYLYADKGTYATAPYLDIHGEADPGFRKHRPLYLNKARYDEVRKLWLNHSVATLVARKLESATDPGGWNTF